VSETSAGSSSSPQETDAATARTLAPSLSWRDLAIGLAATCGTLSIWAAWPVVTRHGVTGALDPMSIAVLRFLPPALILAPFWLRAGLFPKLPWPVLFGLFCGGLPFFIGAAEGFRLTSVANTVAVASGVIPVSVAVMTWLIFGARIPRTRLIGLGLIVIAILIAGSYGILAGGPYVWLGQLLFASSNVAFAIYTVAFPFARMTAMQATGIIAVWSLIIVAPFGLPGVINAVQQGLYGEIGLQLLQQGVLSAMVAFLTYSIAIKRLGPSRAATLVALAPLLSSTAAYFVLDEVPGVPVLIALVFTTVGVALASRVEPAKS